MRKSFYISGICLLLLIGLSSSITVIRVGQISATGTPSSTTFLRGDGTWAAEAVTLSNSVTLTNKTLTTPVIASISNTGTITVPSVTGTLVQYAEGSTTSASTITPTGDARQNYYDVTALATAPTFAAPSGTAANHNLLTIRIKDNGTARALTWNAIYRAGTTVSLPTTTTISKTMHVQFEYNSADTKWDLVGVVDGF